MSDEGEVEVTLANGERRIIYIPIEQVDLLRRAAFLDERRQLRDDRFKFEG